LTKAEARCKDQRQTQYSTLQELLQNRGMRIENPRRDRTIAGIPKGFDRAWSNRSPPR
jgi:hypothetical protein